MSILPTEIWREILHYYTITSLDHTLTNVQLVCRHLRAVALEQRWRAVALQGNENILQWSEQLDRTGSGYGVQWGPVHHLGFFGHNREETYVEQETEESRQERIETQQTIARIIHRTALALVSLVLFNVPADTEFSHLSTISFPLLQDLVFLETDIMFLHAFHGDLSAQYARHFPRLQRLYLTSMDRYTVALVFEMKTLRTLRLCCLDAFTAPYFKTYALEHITRLIIDIPQYQPAVYLGGRGMGQPRETYQKWIDAVDEMAEKYHGTIVHSSAPNALYPDRRQIIKGWQDGLLGRDGYWDPMWFPTLDDS